MTEEETLELLRESGALLTGHFELSSGLHSAGYLQCAVALQHAPLAEQLGASLADRWRSANGEPISAVISPALGGVVIGHEVGRALGARALFTERVENTMTLRRGFALEPAETLLLVEDVVTTGRSTGEVLDVIRELGAEPVGVACIANRSGEDSLGGLPIVSLVELAIPTFEPDACPDCDAGEPVEKPGSRPAP